MDAIKRQFWVLGLTILYSVTMSSDVDGNWSSWYIYTLSSCSSECTRIVHMVRYCSDPPPSELGKPCKGDNSKTVKASCMGDNCTHPENYAKRNCTGTECENRRMSNSPLSIVWTLVILFITGTIILILYYRSNKPEKKDEQYVKPVKKVTFSPVVCTNYISRHRRHLGFFHKNDDRTVRVTCNIVNRCKLPCVPETLKVTYSHPEKSIEASGSEPDKQHGVLVSTKKSVSKIHKVTSKTDKPESVTDSRSSVSSICKVHKSQSEIDIRNSVSGASQAAKHENDADEDRRIKTKKVKDKLKRHSSKEGVEKKYSSETEYKHKAGSSHDNNGFEPDRS